MKAIVEILKSHKGIIGREFKEEYDLEITGHRYYAHKSVSEFSERNMRDNEDEVEILNLAISKKNIGYWVLEGGNFNLYLTIFE